MERQMTDNTMLDVAQIPLSPCFAGGGGHPLIACLRTILRPLIQMSTTTTLIVEVTHYD